MVRSGLKAVAAVLASVALAGVVAPPAANASLRSVQVQVCDDNSRPFNFKIFGRNQNGQEVQTGYSLVRGGGCTLQAGWWWAVDSYVQIIFNFADNPIPRGDRAHCTLEPGLRDGSTKTCRIS